MVTAEVGGTGLHAAAAEHRAGNDAVVPFLELARAQCLQVGAQPGTQQPGPLDLGSGERDNAVGVQAAVQEQPADGDHVLVTDGPDHALGAGSNQKMDMRTR